MTAAAARDHRIIKAVVHGPIRGAVGLAHTTAATVPTAAAATTRCGTSCAAASCASLPTNGDASCDAQARSNDGHRTARQRRADLDGSGMGNLYVGLVHGCADDTHTLTDGCAPHARRSYACEEIEHCDEVPQMRHSLPPRPPGSALPESSRGGRSSA